MHRLRTLNFTYFHQIIMVSGFKHDPRSTENVLNPPQEWLKYISSWGMPSKVQMPVACRRVLRNSIPRASLKHGLIPCFRRHATSHEEEGASALASSGFNFEEDLQRHRHSEWEARNAEDHPDRQLIFSKDIAQQLRGSVSNLRLCKEASFGCQVCLQLERAQMVSRGGEYVQGLRCVRLRVPVQPCTLCPAGLRTSVYAR